jgi:hypothetical protein
MANILVLLYYFGFPIFKEKLKWMAISLLKKKITLSKHNENVFFFGVFPLKINSTPLLIVGVL